ncbi:hypothetical protein NPIL_328541 [Nephila pilipes]|uniref:Zinc finger double-stranded RNA binding domain-containing protein n=1 Tax=Nephila pilipes TaxID=299642 RepID=A0A8X6ILQ2_NEPPI|nr:hypothetical protein NPIL_328541 [Nephila pilipes]
MLKSMAYFQNFINKKQIAPYLYNEVKTYHRRKAESVYLRELIYHKKKYGSGKVRVFHDRPKSDPVLYSTTHGDKKKIYLSWQQCLHKEIGILSHITQRNLVSENDDPISVTQEKKPLMKEVGASAPALFKLPSHDDCLDTRSGDFRCSMCDIHMKTIDTWKAHVTGKEHLKTVKKGLQGSAVNSKFVKAPPDMISNLERMLEEKCVPDFIVGTILL